MYNQACLFNTHKTERTTRILLTELLPDMCVKYSYNLRSEHLQHHKLWRRRNDPSYTLLVSTVREKKIERWRSQMFDCFFFERIYAKWTTKQSNHVFFSCFTHWESKMSGNNQEPTRTIIVLLHAMWPPFTNMELLLELFNIEQTNKLRMCRF